VFVGVARFDLRLGDCTSLKDKRAVLRSLTTTLHNRFRCSIAEVEHQQLTQRATIGVSIVSGQHFQARKVLQQIERALERVPGAEILGASIDVWSEEDR